MTLEEEIRNNFNRGYFNKGMKISTIPDEYPAFTEKTNEYVAVAVPFYSGEAFKESFSKCTIETEFNISYGNICSDFIVLKMYGIELRNEFATLCVSFVDPGPEGKNRIGLLTSPVTWWEKWKKLVGNIDRDKSTYAILGEMITVEKLLDKGLLPSWTGKNSSTHDIETDTVDYEVKSTVKRYEYNVTISSIYQLNSGDKKLELVFCRFEESPNGRSIEDLAESLKSKGYNADEIEEWLEGRKLEKGREARNKKYKLIEMKQYHVDDRFPKITEESFVNHTLPESVISMTYTVTLAGLESINLLSEYS